MRVLMVEPGMAPYEKEINGLEEMQAAVGALEERRKPSGQRCAYACRCPEASRPRWAA